MDPDVQYITRDWWCEATRSALVEFLEEYRGIPCYQSESEGDLRRAVARDFQTYLEEVGEEELEPDV